MIFVLGIVHIRNISTIGGKSFITRQHCCQKRFQFDRKFLRIWKNSLILIVYNIKYTQNSLSFASQCSFCKVILHFTLNNFCKPPKYEYFLSELIFWCLLSPHFAKISQKVFHAYQKFPERKIFFPPMNRKDASYSG